MGTRLVAPVRARNLVWVLISGAAYAAASIWGTPHLRIAYRWTGSERFPFYRVCEYWGLARFTLSPSDGRCPVVVLARREAAR